jgi:uncharacterized protein (DUF1810 family)
MAMRWENIVARAKGKRAQKTEDTDSPRILRTSPRWGSSKRDEEDDNPSPGDPHELVSRFIWTHQSHFDDALEELKRGHKCSCWMWYIFPTPPWIVNGHERGSWTNMRYSLRTDEQAKAYLCLTHAGVNLRKNYYDASEAIVFHLEKGKTARQIVGIADEPKLISSWEYFAKMTSDEPDQALHLLITKGLALIKGPPGNGNKIKKKTKGFRSSKFPNYSSSDEEEPEGSLSPTPSAMSTTSNNNELSRSEINPSELSEMSRCTSEVSQSEIPTVDMAYCNSETKSPTATDGSSEPSMDQSNLENQVAIETDVATSTPVVYCDSVDCFTRVPCRIHQIHSLLSQEDA